MTNPLFGHSSATLRLQDPSRSVVLYLLATVGCFMKRMVLLVFSAVLAVCGSFLRAQENELAGHAPDGDTFEIINNITIPPLRHAPFNSVVTAEWAKTLEDGSTITRYNHRIVVRDAAGRIYQERRTLVPKNGKAEPLLARIEISDPAQHIKYFCHPQNKLCELRNYTGPPAEVVEPVGSTGEGKMVLTRQELGKSNVSGVEVTGTRETRFLAAGVIGNDRPISITKEFWYSPQLGLNMLVKRSDPRVGTQTFTVTEVSLSEPDPNYFRIPAGFKVVDMRSPEAKEPAQRTPGMTTSR